MVSNSHLKTAILATLICAIVSQTCPAGQVPNPNGTCIDVIFIEGCLNYQTKDTCASCEFSNRVINLRL
jgi:branched-subunit amino acid permease